MSSDNFVPRLTLSKLTLSKIMTWENESQESTQEITGRQVRFPFPGEGKARLQDLTFDISGQREPLSSQAT